MIIDFINESTILKPAEVQAYIAAQQIQLTRDFWPAWGLYANLASAAKPTPGHWIVHLLDNSDQADALGYHQEENELPVGYVFVKTSIAAGEDWTATASHEVLEMLADPLINLAATAIVGSTPTDFAYEVADPVEGDEYDISKVKLSNFVLPSWFKTKKAARYDFLGRLQAPLSMTPGGYFLYSTKIGTWKAKYGKNVPARHREPTRFGRRYSRILRAFHAQAA